MTLKQLKHTLPQTALKTIYHTLIQPHLIYCLPVWETATQSTLNSIAKLQKRAIRYITHAPYNAHTENIFKSLNILKLKDLITQQISLFMYKYYYKILPPSFQNMFQLILTHGTHQTRSNKLFYSPTPASEFSNRLPIFSYPIISNPYSHEIVNKKSIKCFSNTLKKFFCQIIINDSQFSDKFLIFLPFSCFFFLLFLLFIPFSFGHSFYFYSVRTF